MPDMRERIGHAEGVSPPPRAPGAQPGAARYHDIVHEVLGPLIPRGALIALFDYPNYSNVGDSAIWLGEVRYLASRVGARIVAVDDLGAVGGSLPPLPESAVILIQGGGNFGDLYPLHQALRRKIVSHYRGNRVIQLPQSIHYQDERNMEECRAAFGGHKDFHLLVRDHPSLELARRLHDGPTHLCPDMALCLETLARTGDPAYPLVGLLRTDKEKVAKDAPTCPDGEELVVMDWVSETPSSTARATAAVERLQTCYPRWTRSLYGLKRRLYDRLAGERLARGCALLCSGQVVITDRLHGHIMCCLLGIPHVVLDNSYRKIGNFRDAWGTGEGLCVSADSLSDACEKAFERLLEARSTKH